MAEPSARRPPGDLLPSAQARHDALIPNAASFFTSRRSSLRVSTNFERLASLAGGRASARRTSPTTRTVGSRDRAARRGRPLPHAGVARRAVDVDTSSSHPRSPGTTAVGARHASSAMPPAAHRAIVKPLGVCRASPDAANADHRRGAAEQRRGCDGHERTTAPTGPTASVIESISGCVDERARSGQRWRRHQRLTSKLPRATYDVPKRVWTWTPRAPQRARRRGSRGGRAAGIRARRRARW